MRATNHSSRFIEMFEDDRYQKVRLGDYTDLTWGDTNTTKNSYAPDGYLAFSAGGPDGKLDHYDYDREGIVLSAIGADCGKTWYTSGKWSCIKNTIRFWSTSDALDNYFLFLATRDKEFWPRRGGAQPFIPQTDARNCLIPLPPLSLQRQFISLANLADKSKFNGFKSRFIEMFASSEKMKLSDVAIITMGASPDSAYYNKEGNGIPFYQGKTEFGDMFIGEATMFCSEPVKTAERGDILMSVRAPVGTVNICSRHCCIGRGLASIRSRKVEPLYMYYALRLKELDLDALGTGSTFKAINKDTLFSFQIEVGDASKQTEFVGIAQQADKSKYLN